MKPGLFLSLRHYSQEGEPRDAAMGDAAMAAAPTWPQYEVHTREHVEGLARYLRQRTRAYGRSPLRVLEVGAGDGRLAHHLRAALQRLTREEDEQEDKQGEPG